MASVTFTVYQYHQYHLPMQGSVNSYVHSRMYHVSHTLSRRENNMKYERNQNKSQLIEMVFFVFQSRMNALQISL